MLSIGAMEPGLDDMFPIGIPKPKSNLQAWTMMPVAMHLLNPASVTFTRMTVHA